MRAGLILFLAIIATAPAGCADASFGLGTEDDTDTGTDTLEPTVDSVTFDTSSKETANDITDPTDGFVAETTVETAPEVLDTAVVGDIKDVAEAEVKPPSRCIGKGVEPGHVTILFEIPPCCARPSGCLTFAASVDGATWKDPICSAGSSGQNSLMCDFGTSAKNVTFLVGVATACGGSIDPTRPITGASGSTYLACKGETELGYCDSVSCSGALSRVSDKFKLSI